MDQEKKENSILEPEQAALRTARDLDAGEEEWMKFVEELKRRKG